MILSRKNIYIATQHISRETGTGTGMIRLYIIFIVEMIQYIKILVIIRTGRNQAERVIS
jgi:hypothetical protein